MLTTKGRPSRQCAGMHQFVISHIEQHSKKPEEVRDKIVHLMGDLPRVELFARQKTAGWDVWRNEVDCDITIKADTLQCTKALLLLAMETAGAENMPENSERNGLGTTATRTATIEKLILSGLVE